jgi:hypothetical protein
VSAPAFDNEAGHALTCMTHQQHRPTSAYTGGQQASSELLLGMFAYYTANGTKAYCDGKPPTDTRNLGSPLRRIGRDFRERGPDPGD